MLHAILALIFVKRLAVKFIKTVGVLREMGRHKIKDHADTCLVQGIYKCHKIVWRSKARGRGVIARHLIAPRAVKGMLHHGHQLDVGVAHRLDVGGQLRSKLAVGVIAAVGMALE